MHPETFEIQPARPDRDHDFTFPLEVCDQVPPGLVFLTVEGEDSPFMVSTLKELGASGPPGPGWMAVVSKSIAADIKERFRISGAQSFSLGSIEIATQAAADSLADIARSPLGIAVLGDGGLQDVLKLASGIGDRIGEQITSELSNPDVKRILADIRALEPDLRPIPPGPPNRVQARGVPYSRSDATKRKRDPSKDKARRKRAAKARKKNRK